MYAYLRISLLIVICPLALGCGSGDSMIKARGRVIKEGKPFTPTEGEGLRSTFARGNLNGTTEDA